MAIQKRIHPAAVACAVILGLSTFLSYLAAASKSPTFDEPHHALAGWVGLHYGDFRLDPENLPLWEDWAALPNGADAIHPDFNDQAWLATPNQQFARFDWTKQTLWRTPGNDGDAFVGRSRVMMLPFGVVLGILIARWSWELAGPAAGVCACIAFAMDPNFLAHTPLVKNDVPIACAAFALTFAVWKLGGRITIARIAAVLLIAAISLGIKFTAPMFVIIGATLLVVRALLPQPWPIANRMLSIRSSRFFATIGMCLLVVVVAFASVWAMYGFRFSPTPDPNVLLDMQPLVQRRAANTLLRVDPHRMPTTQELQNIPPDALVRTVLFCQKHRLLPQAWLWGLLVQYAANIYRATFLMGVNSEFGPWYYFPMAMLFKTPVATLAAILATAILLPFKLRKLTAEKTWAILCLATAATIYFASSMASGVGVGIRHILPVYPAIFVAIGIAGSFAWRAKHVIGRATVVLLAALLCVETFAAFPDYIAFFNFACGGTRNGIHLLADSNLDWGQDLKLLSQWQQEHTDAPLYIAYFGSAEPGFYGIRYRNVLGSEAIGQIESPRGSCYVAISATILQGIGTPEEFRDYYKPLRAKEPFAVLGGTIYIFDFRQQSQ